MFRCITCLPNVRGQAAPREFFFDEDNAAEAAAAELFVQREDRPGFGVFCCPNPLTERKRCRDTVAAIEWLWVDLDFKDVEEAPGDIDLYYDMLHCAPTRVIDSGHGRHIFWRLKEPLERATDGSTAHVIFTNNSRSNFRATPRQHIPPR